MKKSRGKKLQLARETLKTLAGDELDKVNGGFTVKASRYNCPPPGPTDKRPKLV